MNDLISRRAAIDALCSVCENDCDKTEFVYNAPQWEQVIMCPEHYALSMLPSAQPEIIQCKECKYFEYDHIENVNGIPLIVAHEICMRWCEGVKTSENGYCFLAERKDNE